MKRVSLFAKLSSLLLITTVIGLLITHFGMFLQSIDMRRKISDSGIISLTDRLLASELRGMDEASRRALLKKYMLDLRIAGSGVEWTSSPDVPSLSIVKKMGGDGCAFWYHGDFVSSVDAGGLTFIFQRANPMRIAGFPWEMALTFSVMIIILLGAVYLTIRKFLGPLKTLHGGVKRMSEGDFTVRLTRLSNDELGDVIDSFNRMAQRICDDIRSRDQLIRDISHELRSPLSRMAMAIEMLPEDHLQQTLRNNVQLLDKMTTTILEEERIDSPYGTMRLEPVVIGDLIDDIIAQKRQPGRPQVHLLQHDRIELPVDRERLHMALANVIDNAAKYSGPDAEAVEISLVKTDRVVRITVRDHGIGIPEEDLPFVFEPFFRVDKARKHNKGYGLGMGLTKKIVTAHRGIISIGGCEDGGTVVTIELPVIPSPH